MMRMHVNLARHPAENRRRAWIVWGGSLGLLSAVLIVLGIVALVGWRRSRVIQSQTDALRAQMAPLLAGDRGLQRQLNDPTLQATLNQAAYFNQLLDRKSISWTRLFERLEAIMPAEVEMVSLKPIERKGSTAVDLVFASDSYSAANDFVKGLEGSGDFANAQVLHEITSTRAANAGGAENRAPKYQFEITVLYKPSPEPAAEPPAEKAEPAAATSRRSRTGKPGSPNS